MRNIEAEPTRSGAQNFHMHTARHEDEERRNLLATVTVDELGIATCKHQVAGTVLRLAAVHVDNTDTAQHIPLQQGNNNLIFPWPSNVPGKLGFFVEHNGPSTTGVAFRMGEYPGIPLIASSRPVGPAVEWLVAVTGITKPTEQRERDWATKIDLHGKLEFNPDQTRGLFRQAIQRGPGSTVWKRTRLAYRPPTTRRKSASPTSPYVYADTFQILAYETIDRLGAVSVQSLQGAFEVQAVAAS